MTDNEKAAMTDCYKFLDRFDNPVAKGERGCEEYWEGAGKALLELVEKNQHHPLAVEVGVAIYTYLEEKWKAVNRKKGV